GVQLDGQAAAAPADGVADAGADVDEEGVAELPELRLGHLLAARAPALGVVLTGAVGAQLGEEVLERPLAQAADALRRKLDVGAVAAGEAGLLQELRQAGDLLEMSGRFGAEDLAHQVLIDAIEVELAHRLTELALELVDVVE